MCVSPGAYAPVSEAAVLGIDIGTTACKAVLVDERARVVATAEIPHDLSTPHPGWAEENPEDWWRGAVGVTRQLLRNRPPHHIRALGVSGMVPALVVLDDGGRVVRPAIQQNDARAVDEIAVLRDQFPEETFFPQTGATWNQQVIPPKLLWLRRHEPATWARLRRICGSYEFVTGRLTGTAYTEVNWALESGMWAPRHRTWMESVLAWIGLPPEALAPVRWPYEPVGTLTARAADDTGLPRDTMVIAGSADHIAAGLAAGLAARGDVVLKLGSAGDFLYAVEEFAPIRELFIDYHDRPGLFVLNGCMAASGSLVKWFRDRFRPGASYADLDAAAATVPPGSDGLIVLPYFLGEKTPLHDPWARGTVLGLTLSHTPAHLYRAILEGVAFGFRHHIEVLEHAGYRAERLFVVDGGARSDVWCTILASVLGRALHRIVGGETGSAYGVALVAGVAAGLWDWEALPRAAITGMVDPQPGSTAVYDDAYGVYRDAYRRLRDLFPRLRWTRADRS